MNIDDKMHEIFKGKVNQRDRLRRIWSDMKARCYNPASDSFRNYGARGITVCREWKNDFTAFSVWAMEHGYRQNLSIDRIDNDKGYEPSEAAGGK
ncbi:MAG: hypothetical protein K2P44_11570 [Lachnospiraceae bacterium]|nr:hypothetical protein [Lachnospiraceae bacterium]